MGIATTTRGGASAHHKKPAGGGLAGLQADSPSPPIMAFSLGSLGFLTPFEFSHKNVGATLHRVLHQPVPITLRMRLRSAYSIARPCVARQFTARWWCVVRAATPLAISNALT